MAARIHSVCLVALFLATLGPGLARGGDERGPAVGTEAPDFTLEALDGTEIRLSEYRGESPILLVFFRGAW